MWPNQINSIPLLPVRDQKKARTCLAFATSSAHENLHGSKDYLSPAYLYGLAWPTDKRLNGYNGLTIQAVENVIPHKGQVSESVFPYDPWLGNGFPNATHATKENHFLANLSIIKHSFEEVCAHLKAATPVIMGIRITDAFYSVDKDGYIAEPGTREMGGHAVVAVGSHQTSSSKNFLLIRNSWGTTWGKDGYALVSQPYIMSRLMFAAVLNNKGP